MGNHALASCRSNSRKDIIFNFLTTPTHTQQTVDCMQSKRKFIVKFAPDTTNCKQIFNTCMTSLSYGVDYLVDQGHNNRRDAIANDWRDCYKCQIGSNECELDAPAAEATGCSFPAEPVANAFFSSWSSVLDARSLEDERDGIVNFPLGRRSNYI